MGERGPSYRADAVVTGAGSGIGRAIAIELAARGGRVLVADLRLDAAEATVATIERAGGVAKAARCDVASLADVESLRGIAEAWFGGDASLVVNNAGVGVGGRTIEETSQADWEWIVGVNLWGVVNGCRVFVPGLRRRGSGGVLNVSSAASFGAAPRMGAYNVTKAGVLALSETLHAELAGTDVRVSVLCPTFVKTSIVRNSRIGSSSQSESAQSLMDRTGMDPESVAKIALDGLDAGRIHILPQFDARVGWVLKRVAPGSYTRGMGLVARFMPRE